MPTAYNAISMKTRRAHDCNVEGHNSGDREAHKSKESDAIQHETWFRVSVGNLNYMRATIWGSNGVTATLPAFLKFGVREHSGARSSESPHTRPWVSSSVLLHFLVVRCRGFFPLGVVLSLLHSAQVTVLTLWALNDGASDTCSVPKCTSKVTTSVQSK
ncbi:hypothetical protein TRVL_02826 [Trypanosoma vivax]|nr:hypothetical protein TRVL_02826 [Trypanosoma vivax]